MLLFPADPLNPRRPDEHFAPEAHAADELGLPVAIIDDEALGRDPSAAVRRVPAGPATATYRGWMVRSEHYRQLADALAAREVSLRTEPASYSAAHELPGWYPSFAAHTAMSRWLPGPGLDGIDEIVAEFGGGAAVIKDYVKSEKRYWHEAAYIPDLDDLEAVRRVVSRFLELRDEELVGGVVVRAFERYRKPEVRTWWRDGEHTLTTAHPDDPDVDVPDVPTGGLRESVRALGSPFVTVDLARRDDDQWRVIEVGDGQVSDRPSSIAPGAFLRAVC